MKFHILTLFPEMVMQGLCTSIIGRAMEKKILEIDAVNIRNYTLDKHGKVDDYPYGGGAGMLMQAQPVFDAYQALAKGKKIRTVYVTPQGKPFTQKIATNLAKEEELVFLCGHYEGIDERVLEEIVTDYISIGDYVLTGGELPAMVMIDAISRLVPGVLNNDISAETETFHNDLLEYPQYSRPEEWRGKKVPAVLLSGNHRTITKWRLEQSKERTQKARPDLYEKYLEKEKLIKQLAKQKRNNIHMMESLFRGMGEILYWKNGNVLIYQQESRTCLLSAENEAAAKELFCKIPDDTEFIVSSSGEGNDVCEQFGWKTVRECLQACYTKRETLPLTYKEIRLLTAEQLDYVAAHCGGESVEYLVERVQKKAMYGAFSGGHPIGFMGIHSDGSMGMLFVEKEYDRKEIGESLESYLINRQLEAGFTPYMQIPVKEGENLRMQEKLGLYLSGDTVFRLGRKDEGFDQREF